MPNFAKKFSCQKPETLHSLLARIVCHKQYNEKAQGKLNKESVTLINPLMLGGKKASDLYKPAAYSCIWLFIMTFYIFSPYFTNINPFHTKVPMYSNDFQYSAV